MAYSENGMNEENMNYNENTAEAADGAYENTASESVPEAETPAEAAEVPAEDEQSSV